MGLYILESYKGANLFTRIALMLLTGALYVGWYAYCTASWGRTFPTADSDYFVGYGVWRIGDNQFSNSNPTASTGNNAPLPTIVTTDGWLLKWYGAFQAFATLGFVTVNVGYVLIVLRVYVSPCKGQPDLPFWTAIVCITGSVCWLVAVALFGAQFDDTYDTFAFKDPLLGYSFYLAIIVCVLQLVAGILLLLPTSSAGGGGGAVTSA